MQTYRHSHHGQVERLVKVVISIDYPTPLSSINLVLHAPLHGTRKDIMYEKLKPQTIAAC